MRYIVSVKQQLARVDFIEAQIAQLEAEMEKQNAPFEEAVSLLVSRDPRF